MLRRGAWQGTIEVVSGSVQPGSTPAGVCLVLAGTWRDGAGEGYRPGHGLWWGERAEEPLPLAPEDAHGAVLAWIGLAPDAVRTGVPALQDT